jgi:hypothetical protein
MQQAARSLERRTTAFTPRASSAVVALAFAAYAERTALAFACVLAFSIWLCDTRPSPEVVVLDELPIIEEPRFDRTSAGAEVGFG